MFLDDVPVEMFFAAITNFLAVRPICILLSLLLVSGIADLSLLTIPSTSSVWRYLLSLRFLPLPTMPCGQMSDPLLRAVCSSLLHISLCQASECCLLVFVMVCRYDEHSLSWVHGDEDVLLSGSPRRLKHGSRPKPTPGNVVQDFQQSPPESSTINS